jgi:hypothetical protein
MPTESRCINHHHREATGRCRRCNIPLCTECKIIEAEGTFCSEKCLRETKVFVKRAKELEKDTVKSRPRFPMRQLVIAILVVLAAVVLLRMAGVTSAADFGNLIRRIVNTIRRG